VPTPSTESRLSRRELYAILACVLIGSVLRLLWPSDREWKGDEQTMFAAAMDAVRHASLPWIGMPSGAALANPGFSVWPFAFFARWTSTPVGMVQWVQWLNVLALWGFLAFAWFRAPDASRATWLWGVALFAVSPLPILFARKLWAQDLLPMLGMPILWAHYYRRVPVAAFAWGMLGALIGQLHMSGFLFAFSLLLATVLFASARRDMRASSWIAWLAGSACGALPLIPWLADIVHPGHHPLVANVRHIIELKFYTSWFLDAWGIDLAYAMKSFFWNGFLGSPIIGGDPTYVMGIVHVVLVGIALYATGAWVLRRFRFSPRAVDATLLLYLTATGVIMGALMTLSTLRIHPHYLIVASPFVHIWVVAVLRGHRRLLATVVALQLMVSMTFLAVVHERGGIPEGDYGTSYRVQR
jgi:hypothetical protein